MSGRLYTSGWVVVLNTEDIAVDGLWTARPTLANFDPGIHAFSGGAVPFGPPRIKVK